MPLRRRRIQLGEIWSCELHGTSDPRQWTTQPDNTEFPGGETSSVHGPHASTPFAFASWMDHGSLACHVYQWSRWLIPRYLGNWPSATDAYLARNDRPLNAPYQNALILPKLKVCKLLWTKGQSRFTRLCLKMYRIWPALGNICDKLWLPREISGSSTNPGLIEILYSERAAARDWLFNTYRWSAVFLDR